MKPPPPRPYAVGPPRPLEPNPPAQRGAIARYVAGETVTEFELIQAINRLRNLTRLLSTG